MADYTTEVFVDGAWQDITPDVRDSAPITMERGRRDWATDTDSSTCSLRLNNGVSKVSVGTQGRYSPQNPRSDLYEKIGRNTQLRVSAPAGLDNYLLLPGDWDSGSSASTPDHADLDIVGDLDVRIDIEPRTWRPVDRGFNPLLGGYGLARKWTSVGNQRSYGLVLDADGLLSLSWSTDGTEAGMITAVSTAAVPATSTRLALRATIDVNNGAAGKDINFYTAPTIDGSWTQLGATVTTAGVTSIFASTATLGVGTGDDDEGFGDGGDPLDGKVYAFELRNGIGGTIVADPDFRAQDSATTGFVDDAGRTWTLNGHATMANPNARFHGEVTSWPQEWDRSGSDVYAPVKAFGLLRRLGQGSTPAQSSLFRDISIRPEVVAYFPLEEARGATRFNSGLLGDTSFLLSNSSTQVTAADDGDTFVASYPLPTLGTGTIFGAPPVYAGATSQRFVFLISIPEDVTWASDKLIAQVLTNGTIKKWNITARTTGTLRVQAYNEAGTEIANTLIGIQFFGVPCLMSLELVQNGTAVDWAIGQHPLGVDPTVSTGGASIAAQTYDRITGFFLGFTADMEGTTFGHAFILNDDVDSFLDAHEKPLLGWAGETVPDRIVRLCHREGIPVSIVGDIYPIETLLGPQLPATFLDLLRQAAGADLGILYEPREFLGLAYRTRASLYSQEPALTLDYASGMLAEGFRPVEDDQAIRNDVTVKRQGGTSARAELTSGPMSTATPPDGVGRYDTETTISLSDDADLADQAGWRLHLGTVDEPRFPEVPLNLRNPRVEALLDEILAVREGDIIRITNPPEWLSAGPYDLFVEGFREEKSSVTHVIAFTCTPGSAWSVGVYDEDSGPGEARYSSDGSTINEDLTTTETDVGVATPSGPLWGDDHAPFDIVIGGERMTVTAVTGATSPQVFTVTRSVNGVIKTHASGAEVALYKPARYAL